TIRSRWRRCGSSWRTRRSPTTSTIPITSRGMRPAATRWWSTSAARSSTSRRCAAHWPTRARSAHARRPTPSERAARGGGPGRGHWGRDNLAPMPSLQRVGYFLIGLLLLALPASATWSILIINLATGEIAVGIATCLTGFDLRPNTVVVVPGFGVAAAQSFVGPLSLRELIRTQILNGTSANQILTLLANADTGHQSRQYGIASLIGGTATFTGTGAGAWAGGLTGQTGSLLYTVQGNVLTGQPVITAAEQAILTTPGDLAE